MSEQLGVRDPSNENLVATRLRAGQRLPPPIGRFLRRGAVDSPMVPQNLRRGSGPARLDHRANPDP